MKVKYTLIFILLMIMISQVVMPNNAFGWGCITHYYLCQKVSSSEVFKMNGTNPDIFVAGMKTGRFVEEWRNRVHCPNPDDPRTLINDEAAFPENFACIMSRYASLLEEDIWKGWGVHNAADWVAHDKRFLLPYENKFHARVEGDMDFYLYVTQGTLPKVNLQTNPKLIWKALVTKRLIELKREYLEKNIEKPDGELRQDAIANVNSNCPIDNIKASAETWATVIVLRRIQCAGRKLWLGADGVEKFKKAMENSELGTCILKNYSAAGDAGYIWYRSPDSMSNGIPQDVKNSVVPRPKYNEKDPKEIPQEVDKYFDDYFYEVIDKAGKEISSISGEPIMKVRVLCNSDDDYRIEVECTDEARLTKLFEETVNKHLSAPSCDADLVSAQLAKSLFINVKANDTLDYFPPVITNLSPTDGAVASSTITISAKIVDPAGGSSGVDTSSITLKIDNQEISQGIKYDINSCVFSYTPSALSSGTHSLFLQAFDQTGNPSYPVRANFRIDTTPPDTFILSGPTGKINSNSATFEWCGTDTITPASGLQYSYNIDNTPWSAWTSTTKVSYSKLTDGTHTFFVKARDEAGNVDTSPATRVFIVVVPPPVIPVGLTYALTMNTVSLNWSSNKEYGFTLYNIYRNGTKAGIATTSSYTDSRLGIGTFTYTVTAVNKEGKESGHSQPIVVNIIPGSISGKIIRLSNKQLLGGVKIEVFQERILKASTITASNGIYKISNLILGDYDIRATINIAIQEKKVTVKSGQEAKMD